MYIISGRGEAVIDDIKSKIYPDMLISVPKGVMHQLINTGDESLKLLWVYSPPGPEEEHLDILNTKNNYKKIDKADPAAVTKSLKSYRFNQR